MVGVSMREQKCINRWKVSDRNSRSAYSWQEATKPRSKVGIGQNTNAIQLDQKRCMADVCDPQGGCRGV